MNCLFWGLFLCLLDYELTIGTAVFDLLPDFLGFLLMMKGMEQLAGENRFFDRGRHMAFGLLIVSVVLFAADLMNPGGMAQVWLWALELVELVVLLVLVRMIVTGVLWLEHDHDLKLRGSLLKSLWTILIVICPLCHLIVWIPLVGDVCRMASTVVSALFLLTFWDCRKTYSQFAE